jgi:signal peptidase I
VGGSMGRPGRREFLVAVLITVVTASGCGRLDRSNRVYDVPSDSMSPAIRNGDKIRVDQDFGEIRRGHVILFKLEDPFGERDDLLGIKRVVGLPGETVELRDDRVLVDGQPIEEAYLSSGAGTGATAPVRLGPDQFYVLGDSRTTSLDSRSTGPIVRSDIVGVVVKITAPKDRRGDVPGSPD